ncbi:MAG: hypothetical protein Tsb0016_15380 [Sphingomonadales bacterium]
MKPAPSLIAVLTAPAALPNFPRLNGRAGDRPAPICPFYAEAVMKIRNSLKSLKSRHRDCRVIRRKGRVYVINKTNRRFKARQG